MSSLRHAADAARGPLAWAALAPVFEGEQRRLLRGASRPQRWSLQAEAQHVATERALHVLQHVQHPRREQARWVRPWYAPVHSVAIVVAA